MNSLNKKEQMIDMITKINKEEGVYNARGRPKKDDVFCRYLALVIVDSIEEVNAQRRRERLGTLKKISYFPLMCAAILVDFVGWNLFMSLICGHRRRSFRDVAADNWKVYLEWSQPTHSSTRSEDANDY